MKKFHKVIPSTVAWSMYPRLLTNLIFEKLELTRGDLEELVRVHERTKIEGSTEKQISSRTKTFLSNLFGRTILDWPTFVVMLKCLRAHRISLTVTFYDAADSAVSVSITTAKNTGEEMQNDRSNDNL